VAARWQQRGGSSTVAAVVETQSPRNHRNNKETHFKRINRVRCLKSGTSTTRC
jgi:hypothetical protein